MPDRPAVSPAVGAALGAVLSRRALLAALPAAGALAACGGPSTDGPATQTVPSSAAPSGADGYEVTVVTPDDGEVTLTTEPVRIAALNGNRVIPFLLPFLTGDRELVGFGGGATGEEFPWIADAIEGVERSPDVDGPSLEAYAGWDADLLLANGNLGDYWEPARAVAPLVQLPETDWRATVRLLGQVFDEPDVADRTIADTEELISEAALTTRVTAVVLSPYQDDGTVGTQVLGAELPNFLADLGVDVARSDTAADGYEDVSLEQLSGLLDVDWVIVVNNGQELQDAFLADPLVTATPPFQAGRVVVLDPQQSAAAFPVTPPTVPVVLDALASVLSDT